MSKRDYIDDRDERQSAFDNEADRHEQIYNDGLCSHCGRKRKDHYTGELGSNRCIDESGIFYGTLRFKNQ